jgi:hypothetical protein
MAVVAPPYKVTPEGGDYAITIASGAVTTIAADGPVWSMRWTSPSLICVVKRVGISLRLTTAYGTAQSTDYGLYVARSWTVSDSGQTAATLTTNNGKLDTKYPTTAIAAGDLRISTTAVVTAGTRTLDAQSIGVTCFATQALAYSGNVDWEYGSNPSRQQVILRQNEGLVIHNMILMSATGVVKLYITFEWAEVPTSSVK